MSQDNPFDLFVAEGDVRLLAWLTAGAGRYGGLYKTLSNVPAPNSFYAQERMTHLPGDPIPLWDVLGEDKFSHLPTEIIGADHELVLANYGSLGSVIWTFSIQPRIYDLFDTNQLRQIAESMLVFDVTAWQPPHIPNGDARFLIHQHGTDNLRAAFDHVYGKGRVTKANGRENYKIAIPHEDVVRFDANAIKKLAGMDAWFASQKEPLVRLLDGELKLLPELDAEIDRLGAQYGAHRVEESAVGAYARNRKAGVPA